MVKVAKAAEIVPLVREVPDMCRRITGIMAWSM